MSASRPFTPPFPWPKPAWLRKGGGKRLGGIWVVHDFLWKDWFSHDRSMFPGGASIAAHVKKWTPPGTQGVLFLTDRLDIETPTTRQVEKHTYVIWSVNAILSTVADLATSAIGRTADSPVTLDAIRKIKKSPETLHKIIQEELTVEQISEWAAIDPERANALAELVAALDGIAPSKSVALALDLLSGLATDMSALEDYAGRAERPTLRLAAAAASYARQYLAIQEFRDLIERRAPEADFQAFLNEHHWIFGTRYVGRWTGRQLNVGNQQDFILRAADGYYDVIEIKRPDHTVMAWDVTHKNHYPSAELSKAIGQVQKYLEDIDHELPAAERRTGIRLHRPQATIVIGDLSSATAKGDLDALQRLKLQREALRGYNSHLSRVTIRTYDELLTMAEAIHGHTQQQIERVLAQEDARVEMADPPDQDSGDTTNVASDAAERDPKSDADEG